MPRPRLEVAEVVRQYGAASRTRDGAVTSTAHRRVLQAVAPCRTAVLGGHQARGAPCGHEEISAHACRHRHCPQCQGSAPTAWLAARERALWDGPYGQVVFPRPAPRRPLPLQHPRVVDHLRWQAVAETLPTMARDAKP
jgi:Transposase zinc-binding domain